MIQKWGDIIYNFFDGFEWFHRYAPDSPSFIQILIQTAVCIPIFFTILFFIRFLTAGLKTNKKTSAERIQSLRKYANKIGRKEEIRATKDTMFYRKFEKTVRAAGHPFGLNPREWYAILIAAALLGAILVCLQTIYLYLVTGSYNPPYFSIMFFPILLGGGTYLFLYLKARTRRHVMQYDFIRAFNRLADLQNETLYDRVRISLAGTRILKEFTPHIGEWNADANQALDKFVERVGIEEAVLYKRTIMYCKNHPESASEQIERVERGIAKFRETEEEKNTKALETGYQAFLYPPFLVAVGALTLPWYQFLKETLHHLLG